MHTCRRARVHMQVQCVTVSYITLSVHEINLQYLLCWQGCTGWSVCTRRRCAVLRSIICHQALVLFVKKRQPKAIHIGANFESWVQSVVAQLKKHLILWNNFWVASSKIWFVVGYHHDFSSNEEHIHQLSQKTSKRLVTGLIYWACTPEPLLGRCYKGLDLHFRAVVLSAVMWCC